MQEVPVVPLSCLVLLFVASFAGAFHYVEARER
jgi:hypothetical protein